MARPSSAFTLCAVVVGGARASAAHAEVGLGFPVGTSKCAEAGEGLAMLD